MSQIFFTIMRINGKEKFLTRFVKGITCIHQETLVVIAHQESAVKVHVKDLAQAVSI